MKGFWTSAPSRGFFGAWALITLEKVLPFLTLSSLAPQIKLPLGENLILRRGGSAVLQVRERTSDPPGASDFRGNEQSRGDLKG